MTDAIHYFAYGSNLHPLRLRQRVPSSRPLGVASLPGHQLRFHKNGRDGSGKCNVLRSDDPTQRVLGAIYAMHPGERHLLDAAEGLGNGYRLAGERLQLDGGSCEVFFYVAEAAHIDDDLLPWCWYLDLVLHGARAHDLPAEYIAALARQPYRDDPDHERRELHRRILRGED